jgi:hypothetical protein
MTTPAVLYDHVPVNEIDERPDDDEKASPMPSRLSSSFRSYFVSRMVHQVSAPPEHTDESRQQQQSSRTQQGFQTTSDDDDDDIDSVCMPMETIWEDNVCTEYVMVPQSALDESQLQDDTAIITSPSRLRKTQDSLNSLFGSKRVSTHDISCTHRKLRAIWGSPSLPSESSGMLQSIVLDPLVYLSCYLFSHARPLPSTSRNGWMSETVVDGNRLILPGDLIVLDPPLAHHNLHLPGQDNDTEGTLIVPGMSESSIDPSIEPASCPKSWWHTSTVMVSAHDILAMERQKKPSHIDLHTTRQPSLWVVPEEGGALPSDENCVPLPQRPITVQSKTIHPDAVAHTWTRALWKFARRRTKYWYRHNYIRVFKTVHQMGKVFALSHSRMITNGDNVVPYTLAQPAEFSESERDLGQHPSAATINDNDADEKGGDYLILSANAIEMTPLKRVSESTETHSSDH